MPAAADLRGEVADYDAHRGYGTVRADDGRSWFFHCTAIADGTREIDEGARVRFAVVPGLLGRWEAVDVRRAAASGSGTG